VHATIEALESIFYAFEPARRMSILALRRPWPDSTSSSSHDVYPRLIADIDAREMKKADLQIGLYEPGSWSLELT
jgi:hypothetical protein